MPISDPDRYSAIVQLVVHSETTSWNRFYHFLVFATLLVLSWTTIYVGDRQPNDLILMASISVLGFLSSFAFAGLGVRGREFVRRYLDLGERIERSSEGAAEINPCVATKTIRDTIPYSFLGSSKILPVAPLLCAILFFLMFLLSFPQWPVQTKESLQAPAENMPLQSEPPAKNDTNNINQVSRSDDTAKTAMEQLKLLMDYTKFHIGMYATLCTALVAVLSSNQFKTNEGYEFYRPYLLGTLICFTAAGMFGGLVGSSIPFYTNWDTFISAKVGFSVIPTLWCTKLEHGAFWLGIVVALAGIFLTPSTPPTANDRLVMPQPPAVPQA
jgi:hypothetical protein